MMTNIQLNSLNTQRTPSVSEKVFAYLHEKILTLELPPGTKMSEAEVSKQMNISRQPVREAFFRLSQLGFLLIRPQRAAVVQSISETEVLQAMYIRAALEIEVVRNSTELITADQLKVLTSLLDQQQQAISDGDKILFHTLDDRFHKNICIAADAEFVWTLIKEKKAHMDRVRYLALEFNTDIALEEHKIILDAIRSKNSVLAVEAVRKHLSRIKIDLPRIRQEHEQYFATEVE